MSTYIFLTPQNGNGLQEENEVEEDLLDQMSSCLSVMLRTYGDAAMQHVEQLMPALAALLQPGASPEERRVAICALDDILEYASQSAE